MPGSGNRREFPPNLVPLSKAIEVFASRRLRRQARLAGEATLNLPSQSEIAGDPIEAARAFGEMGIALVDHVRTQSEPRWEMERQLLKSLYAGKYEAWGIQTKPKVKARPQHIPSYYFSEDKGIAWYSDKIEKFGRRYEGVRVGRPQPVEVSRTTNDPKKPGPKSGRDAILQKYGELNSQGRFKTAPHSLKAIWRIMRPILAKDTTTFPHERGLKYRTFLSHMRALKGKR
jgi:hypothetical protein